MSKRRAECSSAFGVAIPDDTALYLIREAVLRRRVLIRGVLHDGRGRHCALGAFWEDNPGAILYTRLVDEVAAVNDALPNSATPQERWKKVSGWLRWKIKVLAHEK